MDPDQLPDDENGEALRRAMRNGLQLGREHRVRFTVAFAGYANAFQFGCFLLRQGYWVQVDESVASAPDEVLVDMGLDVTHAAVTGAESWLREHASAFDGRPSGWEIREAIERPVRVEVSAP